MMLMAERYWLFAEHKLACYIGSTDDSGPGPGHNDDYEDAAKDRHTRNDVHAAVKDLWHRPSL
jgi:hypothetical protein